MGPTPPPPMPQDFSPYWGSPMLAEVAFNAGTLIFFVGALIELAFLIHYIRVAPAFKSWIGWMFVLRSTSFLLSGLAIVLGRLWGPLYPARPYLTLVLYIAVLISACVTYGTFLFERYKDTDTGAGHRIGSFARRAIGLRARRRQRADDEAKRPTTRPLKIVKDAP